MREPWASVVRASMRGYGGIGMLVAILGFGHLTYIADSASVDLCLARYGIAAEHRAPAQILYLAYKGVLWPVSLTWTVAEGEVTFGNWILGRYDPFAGACVGA